MKTSLPLPPLRTEILAGITTFFTMAYIVVVNPSILATEGTGLSFSGVLTATVVLSATMTLFMGLYAKLPFAVAPGMGINAFFTYTLILGKQVPWQQALGVVFWAGVLFILISATPARVKIAQAIPRGLRSASAAGIGLFLTFIGLKNADIIVADPATLVKLGKLGVPSLLCLGGSALAYVLLQRRSALAFLGPIAAVTTVGAMLGYVTVPDRIVSAPDFSSTFFQLDVLGALRLALLPSILAFCFTDLFDSISTFVGVSQATGLLDEKGDPPRLEQGLLVDAFATMSAGLFGSSSGTAYIESAAGIEAGGRTGRTAIVTALCFVPCLFVGPIAAMVPAFATAPILVLVGALMFRTVSEIPLSRLEDSVPAFLTIALIPLTFSITQGVLWGFLSHVGAYWIAGRRREIAPTMYAIAAISALLLVIENYR
jgi:AGZA family xanthine/uracil permease-like MFS transporter